MVALAGCCPFVEADADHTAMESDKLLAQLKRQCDSFNLQTDEHQLDEFLKQAHKNNFHELEGKVLKKTRWQALPVATLLDCASCAKTRLDEDLSFMVDEVLAPRILSDTTNITLREAFAGMYLNTFAGKYEQLKNRTDIPLTICALAPGMARAYFYRGLQLYAAGKKAEAATQMRKAIKLQPTDQDHWLVLACWLLDSAGKDKCTRASFSQSAKRRFSELGTDLGKYGSERAEALAIIRSSLVESRIWSHGAFAVSQQLKRLPVNEIMTATSVHGLPAERRAHILRARACAFAQKKMWQLCERAARESLSLDHSNGLAFVCLLVALRRQHHSLNGVSWSGKTLSREDYDSARALALSEGDTVAQVVVYACSKPEADVLNNANELLLYFSTLAFKDYETIEQFRGIIDSSFALSQLHHIFSKLNRSMPVKDMSLMTPVLMCAACNSYWLRNEHPDAELIEAQNYFENHLSVVTDCSDISGTSSRFIEKCIGAFSVLKKFHKLSPKGYERLAILLASNDDIDVAVKILTEGINSFHQLSLVKLRAAMELSRGNTAQAMADMHVIQQHEPCSVRQLRSMRRTWEGGMPWERVLGLWKRDQTPATIRHIKSERDYFLMEARHANSPLSRYQNLLTAAELSVALHDYGAAITCVDEAEAVYPGFRNTHEVRVIIFEALGKREQSRASRAQVLALPGAKLQPE